MKKFITKLKYRWIEKLISFVLAIILWLYVSEKNKPEKYISTNLDLRNLPQGTAIASQYKKDILLKVKGRESIIQGLSSRDFNVYLNLKNASLGKNVLPVIVKTPKNRDKFKIIKVEPQNIAIHLDKLEHKEVPVSPTIINNPADGYKKLSESIIPEKIVIKGPKSLVEKIEVIRTKPIDIGGVSGSIYKEVEFDLPEELLIPVDYKTARIAINITKDFKTKIYYNIKIRVSGLKNTFYIQNANELVADVKIYGPLSKLNLLENDNDFLYIDADDIIEDGKYNKTVLANIPKDCSVVYIKPANIELNIEER